MLYAHLHIYTMCLGHSSSRPPSTVHPQPSNDQKSFGHIFIGENWVDALLQRRGEGASTHWCNWSVIRPAAAPARKHQFRDTFVLPQDTFVLPMAGPKIWLEFWFMQPELADCLWVPSHDCMANGEYVVWYKISSKYYQVWYDCGGYNILWYAL